VRLAAAPNIRAPVHSGQPVTVAEIVAGDQRETVPVVATGELASPSFWWRVTHP
jgi:hypothetical protein